MKNDKITLKKPTKRQIKKFLLNFLLIVLGNAIAAAASALFIEPNQFVMGGTTGLGIVVRNIFERYTAVSANITAWVVNITVYVANLILFVIGAFFLGKKFAIGTLAGTVLYPAFMTVFKLVNNAYVEVYKAPIGVGGEGENLILAAVMGSLLFGLGVGIVVRIGSSTGGTDIPALILHKKYNMPVSMSLWIIDLSIVALSLVATDVNMVLYGIVITLLSSFFIEVVSPIGMKRTQVKIISNHYLEIRDMILTKISRGVTILYGQTGYLKEDCHMLLTVISHRQLAPLKAEVQKIDPEAFMTVSVVSEVRGRGFHSDGVDFLMKDEDESEDGKEKRDAKD